MLAAGARRKGNQVAYRFRDKADSKTIPIIPIEQDVLGA